MEESRCWLLLLQLRASLSLSLTSVLSLSLSPTSTPGAQLRLQWRDHPRTVLVVTKPTPDVMPHTLSIIDWLRRRGLYVFVEPKTYLEIMRRRCVDCREG